MVDQTRVPFTDEAVEKINLSIANYRRFAKINIELWPDVADHPDILTVRVTQFGDVNGKILTEKELKNRAEEVFNGLIPKGFLVKYIAVTYPPKK